MDRFLLSLAHLRLIAGVIFILLLSIIAGTIYIYMKSQNSTPNYTEILKQSWKNYKKIYMQTDGRIIDTSSPLFVSTSEGQSYALLRAVFVGDKHAFDTIDSWTKNNMGVRPDGLYAWRWGKNTNGAWGITTDEGGYNSATDGDEQVATALLAAYKKWHTISYLRNAEILIKSIYKYDTYTNTNGIYIVGGNWANNAANPAYIYNNPSYLQIAAFREFQKVDTADNWGLVITTAYNTLQKCINASSNTVHLPTNWCLFDKSDLSVKTTSNYPPEYGYDSFRVSYNLALDYQVSGNKQDLQLLHEISTYFLQQSFGVNETPQVINVATKFTQKQGAKALVSGTIAALYYIKKQEALAIYENTILPAYTKKNFGNGYYDENWNWFITAFLQGRYGTTLYNV